MAWKRSLYGLVGRKRDTQTTGLRINTRMSANPFKIRWLGGRDSNPDTQIQSLSEDAPTQEDQQLNPANHGKNRQNPQRRRKKSDTG